MYSSVCVYACMHVGLGGPVAAEGDHRSADEIRGEGCREPRIGEDAAAKTPDCLEMK